MFCPNCGNSDQAAESYCRKCGTYLPDLTKPIKKEASPEENLKVNTVLTLMTVIVSFTLAALLYIFLGFRETTHPLIYATAGLLIAMGGWHIQTFIRTRRLKRQWNRGNPGAGSMPPQSQTPVLETPVNANFLPDAASFAAVPVSVTESTTKHLDARRPTLPDPEQ